jgi:peptidoglycan hydrolase CwlO-like protein
MTPRTLEWALPYGLTQWLLQALQQEVAENRAQATVLEARMKKFAQQVQELRDRIAGRDTTTEEEPPTP